jgi:hypothetical protein
MGTLKEIVKRMPVIPFVYREYTRYRLRSKSTEEIFTEIYRNNIWSGKESVSGSGSNITQAQIIIQELPKIFREYDVSTILDIPCGDFHWMKNIDLKGISYTGADIVQELIQNNRDKYAGESIRFRTLNLIKDDLPEVDLVFCRDCLVHFSFSDIFFALDNICNSQAKYLLTTTFTERNDNHDSLTGRHWRPINLEIAPFNLPKPLKILHEGCTEKDGAYEDKAIGMWRISDIKENLTEL